MVSARAILPLGPMILAQIIVSICPVPVNAPEMGYAEARTRGALRTTVLVCLFLLETAIVALLVRNEGISRSGI